MARIAGVNLPNQKRLEIGLTYIFGIGQPSAQKICDAPSGSDGTWSANNVILFDGRGNDPIFRVSAGGEIGRAHV